MRHRTQRQRQRQRQKRRQRRRQRNVSIRSTRTWVRVQEDFQVRRPGPALAALAHSLCVLLSQAREEAHKVATLQVVVVVVVGIGWRGREMKDRSNSGSSSSCISLASYAGQCTPDGYAMHFFKDDLNQSRALSRLAGHTRATRNTHDPSGRGTDRKKGQINLTFFGRNL